MALGQPILLETFALALGGVRETLAIAAIGLALSGLDDLFVDSVYFTRRLVRLAVVRPRHPRMLAEAMGSADPGWFAIFVPAWDEGAVIGTMLRGLLASYQWPRYRIFVGCYPNDPATLDAVAAIGDARVERVITARAGPTTKADCLNHLWRAALAHEARTGDRFKAIVLHDAEDVVHGLELRVFDHLIGRFALVQLPVVPLPDAGSRWIAGHYLDEFAESHGKDVIVREALGAAVPSAGVACAIARDRVAGLAGAARGQPFDATCFTEDYELGMLIKRAGGRGALVRVCDAHGVLVATREHFPATLHAAVRQKTRWMLGIALDGWDRLGWAGEGADQYMLWRDRKPLFAAPLLLLAYAAMLGGLIAWGLQRLWPAAAALGPVVPAQSLLATLTTFNGLLLGWRLTLRAVFTAGEHGWREGLRAVPRAMVANLVNTLATGRALRRYLDIAVGREKAAWEKPRTAFPGRRADRCARSARWRSLQSASPSGGGCARPRSARRWSGASIRCCPRRACRSGSPGRPACSRPSPGEGHRMSRPPPRPRARPR